jgi:hypothetical protein
MQENKAPEADAYFNLIQNGDDVIEAIAERFIASRFVTTCSAHEEFFSVAKMERFTRGRFPRFLLDPKVIQGEIPAEQIRRDLAQLTAIFSENPGAVNDLIAALDDPERFRELAVELKLTESDFVKAGGGLLWLIVIVVVAVTLTGCPGPTPSTTPNYCGAQHPTQGVLCTRPRGHGPGAGSAPGGHENKIGGGYRW